MDITITDSSVLPKSITIQESGDVVTVNSTPQPVTIATEQLTTNITGALNDLTDVTITNVQNNEIIAYDSTSGGWINATNSGGGGDVDSVNGQTGVVVLDTDDISEGTNKYYATSLFNTDFGTKDTDDLSEGTTNLYYADSLVDSHLTGGTGVTYSAGDISIGQPVGTTDDVTFNEVESTEFIGPLRGEVLFKAQAGEALTKGDAVYVSGISGNTPIVSKALASSASHMPAFGVAGSTVGLNNPVDVIAFGQATNLDTTGNGSETWALGDEIYVSATTAGDLTNVQPTGESNFVQQLAKVEKLHPTTGTLLISGAGRSNATPNLDDGNIFIGDASNYSVSASLDTTVGNLGYITASSTDTLTNKSGNISQWTNDSGYLTSETDSQTLSFVSPDLSISNGNSVDLSALTTTTLPFSSITSTPTTLAGYGITDGVTGDSTTTFTNKSGNISQWTNDSGYITASSSDTLTNKSGNVSQFTNDSNYLVNINGSSINDLSDVDTTGLANTNVLKYNSTSGNFEPGATGITEVSQDSTPQLGGALDAQTNNITSVGALDATSLEASGDITVGGSIVGDSAALDIKNSIDGANIQFFIDDTTGSSHVPLKMEQYATIRPDDSTAYDATVTMPLRGFRNGTLEFSTTGDQPDNAAQDYELNGFLATSTSKSWTGINLVATGQAASANPLYDRGIGSLQEFPQNVIFLSSANGLVTNPQPLGNNKRVFQLGAFVYDGVKYGGANSIPSFAITCTAAETAASTNARGVKTTFEFLKIGGTGSDGDSSGDRNSTLTLDYDGADIAGDLVVTGDQIDFTNLPTSDPTVAGRLWNDSGTVKISAG